MKKIVECEQCSVTFERYPSRIQEHNFCSTKCQNLSRLIHIYECEVCRRVFHRPVRKNQVVRFCSKDCMYKKLKEERNPSNCECGWCGKRFHKSPSAIRSGEGKYCSRKCKASFQEGKSTKGNVPAYSHYYGLKKWQRTRTKVIKRDAFACQHCGKKPKKHSRLQVHHKKRRIEGGTDDLDNLITLCFSCHKKADGRLY